MKASERDDLIKETHQALLGVKGTEDKGLVGDFKELKEVVQQHGDHLDNHSKRITITETLQKERHKTSKKAVGGYITGAVAIAVALWKAFTGG